MKPFNSKIISNENTSSNQVTYAKLLQQFPKIKFSYELKSYKKVSTHSNDANNSEDNFENVYFIIPKGKKYFVWFKNGECLFLELDNDKQVVNVISKKTSRIFPNDTIFYGTYFYYRNQNPLSKYSSITPTINENILYYFTIENIHYYNGVNIDATQTVFDKLKTLHLAFTTVTPEKTFQIEIGLPYIDTCIERISTLKPFYQVYCIQKKKANDTRNQYLNIHLNMLSNVNSTAKPNKSESESEQKNCILVSSVVTVSKNNSTEPPKKYIEKPNFNNSYNSYSNNKYKVFIVSADIQNDIYHLMDPDTCTCVNDVTSISNKLIASIPDYKTSVLMNALFRNIKENRSLDALEESDDEDEFENTNIDKFVDLTKKIKMKCVFNYKFKKWTPIECVN